MEETEAAEWADITFVDRKVAKVRAGFARTIFTLSAVPPPEWEERFHQAIDADTATAELSRNPGASSEGEDIIWEINEHEISQGWEILKAALADANEFYGELHAKRLAKKAELEGLTEAQEKRRAELDKQLKALK